VCRRAEDSWRTKVFWRVAEGHGRDCRKARVKAFMVFCVPTTRGIADWMVERLNERKMGGVMRGLAGWLIVDHSSRARRQGDSDSARDTYAAIRRRKGAITWLVKEDSCFTVISVHVQVGSEGCI